MFTKKEPNHYEKYLAQLINRHGCALRAIERYNKDAEEAHKELVTWINTIELIDEPEAQAAVKKARELMEKNNVAIVAWTAPMGVSDRMGKE